jgi:hypothetical protein
MGNAIRRGAGRHRLRGNTLRVRRGSRRLAVRVTCQTTGHCTGEPRRVIVVGASTERIYG